MLGIIYLDPITAPGPSEWASWEKEREGNFALPSYVAMGFVGS